MSDLDWALAVAFDCRLGPRHLHQRLHTLPRAALERVGVLVEQRLDGLHNLRRRYAARDDRERQICAHAPTWTGWWDLGLTRTQRVSRLRQAVTRRSLPQIHLLVCACVLRRATRYGLPRFAFDLVTEKRPFAYSTQKSNACASQRPIRRYQAGGAKCAYRYVTISAFGHDMHWWYC